MTTADPDRTEQYEAILKAAEAIGAHVEPTCSGELVVYTGIALDAKENPVDWCEECESGAEVPAAGCVWCGREPEGEEQPTMKKGTSNG